MHSPEACRPIRRYRFVVALLAAFALGLLSYPGLRAVKNALLQAHDRTDLRQAVQPRFDQRPFVVLAIGQSNAANHAGARTFAPGHYAFDQGRFYPLADPLPGCTGSEGSIWPSFAQALAPHLGGRPVVVACLAVSGSGVQEWAPGSPYFGQVRATIEALARSGLAADAIVWHQGETDSVGNMQAAAYESALMGTAQALHALAPGARLFICKVSHGAPGRPLSSAVRIAQQNVIDRLDQASAGVDTDSFGPHLRRDGVHFTLEGAELFGALLAQAVREPRDTPVAPR